jgi:hypothetical protein
VTGTTINGALFFDFLPSNEYDPANGNVPLGFGNEGGPSITVPATFGYQDLFFNTVSAAFTTSELTIAVNVHTIVFNWRQVFTASTTEFFEDLKLVSSSFPNTLAFGVSGDSLTVSDSENMGQGSAVAVFSFGPPRVGAPAPVPELSTWALLIAGFGLFPFLLRWRPRLRPAASE